MAFLVPQKAKVLKNFVLWIPSVLTDAAGHPFVSLKPMVVRKGTWLTANQLRFAKNPAAMISGGYVQLYPDPHSRDRIPMFPMGRSWEDEDVVYRHQSHRPVSLPPKILKAMLAALPEDAADEPVKKSSSKKSKPVPVEPVDSVELVDSVATLEVVSGGE